jgi:DNA repair protein RadC
MFKLKVVRERQPGYGRVVRIQTAQDVFDAFHARAEQSDREVFLMLALDGKNHLLGFHVVSVGSLTTALVHPREVFKVAILSNAASVILLHNHPSGDPEPSAEDRAITGRLRQAGELLGIQVIDHVVIGDGRFVSMAEQNLL